MFLSEALRYARRGWLIFPIKPRQKVPATARGFYDASANPGTLCRWFGHYEYNLGIRTGIASNIFVLDIDGSDGARSLRDLEAHHGALPVTLRSATSRGCHYFFKLDTPLRCSTERVGKGIDIKADFGFVVGAPSVHPNGTSYRWLDDESTEIADAPAWLIDLAQHPAVRTSASTSSSKPAIRRTSSADIYGRSALNSEIRELSKISQGGRNNALNCAAFKLAQLVAGGELDHSEVERALRYACERNGLARDDGWPSVEKTIHSGMNAGMLYPRGRRTK